MGFVQSMVLSLKFNKRDRKSALKRLKENVLKEINKIKKKVGHQLKVLNHIGEQQKNII